MSNEEYLKQNASGLYLQIQQIGCFFRAACHMAELEAKKQNKYVQKLNQAQLNHLWDLAKQFEYIDHENNLVKAEKLATAALRHLDLPGRFVEVAVFQDGKMGWYPGLKGAQKRADYFIQKIRQNGPSKTHFRNVQNDGQLLWDPHDPDINVAGIFYTICFRYDKEL